MPHLEFTYFPSQFFWCLLFFLFTYLTISKGFWSKYNRIIDARKHKVNEYISETNELLANAAIIEKKIEKSKRDLSDEIRKLEENAKKELLKVKIQSLRKVKNKIKTQTLSHEIYLSHLKEKIMSDLKNNPAEIDEKLNSYLFKK